jgi:hypothetical protein
VSLVSDLDDDGRHTSAGNEHEYANQIREVFQHRKRGDILEHNNQECPEGSNQELDDVFFHLMRDTVDVIVNRSRKMRAQEGIQQH